MKLTPNQKDALTEIINIGVGHAASILNNMCNSHVNLTVPEIIVLSSADLNNSNCKLWDDKLSSVQMSFNGSLIGVAALVFPPESASKLVTLLTGERADSPDLDSLKMETLNEVGNIVINGVLGAIGNMLERHVEYAIPAYHEETFETLMREKLRVDGTIILAQTNFSVERENIKGNVMLLFEVNSFESLMASIKFPE